MDGSQQPPGGGLPPQQPGMAAGPRFRLVPGRSLAVSGRNTPDSSGGGVGGSPSQQTVASFVAMQQRQQGHPLPPQQLHHQIQHAPVQMHPQIIQRDVIAESSQPQPVPPLLSSHNHPLPVSHHAPPALQRPLPVSVRPGMAAGGGVVGSPGMSAPSGGGLSVQQINVPAAGPLPQGTGGGMPPGGGGGLSLGGGGDEQSMVAKCVRFFKTLIQLSQQPEPSPQPGAPSTSVSASNRLQTHARVKQLVSDVIYGHMQAEEFTKRLQEALRSQAQPHLLPFLQRTLPFLRNALNNGEVTIEGITPATLQPPQQGTPYQPPPVHSSTPQQLPSAPPLSATPLSHSHHISSTSLATPLPPRLTPQMRQPKDISKMAQTIASVASMKAEPVSLSVKEEPLALPGAVESESSSLPGPFLPADDVGGGRVLNETPIKAAMIQPEELMTRITRKIKDACYVDEDVLTSLSNAAEYRLRSLLEQLAIVTQHRLDPIRTHSNYVAVDDTRRQIRFMEEVDRQADERQQAREKDLLIRMSKNKNTGKETVERAKEMQRMEAEAKRNRDANAAAIAALAPSSRPGGGTAPVAATRNRWGEGGGGGAGLRPRTLRVTLRDVQTVLAKDPHSQMAVRLAYATPQADAL